MEPSIPATTWRLIIACVAFWACGAGATLAADDCSASSASIIDLDKLLSPEQAAAAATMPFGDGTLFRLTREGIAPSYLFGTLHLPDARLIALAKERFSLIRDAGTVVLELAPAKDGSFIGHKPSERQATASAARPKPSRTLRDLLRPAEIERLKRALARRGIAPAVTTAISPAALVFLLDQPTCEPRGGMRAMDQVISDEARAAGKEVVGLETLPEQLGPFDALTIEEARDALLAALSQADVAGVLQDASLRLYLQRKGGVLLTWTKQPRLLPTIPGPPMPQHFLTELVDARNARMQTRLQPLLARGNAFVAIGILHLPGEAGLLSRLTQDGYKIETIN